MDMLVPEFRHWGDAAVFFFSCAKKMMFNFNLFRRVSNVSLCTFTGVSPGIVTTIWCRRGLLDRTTSLLDSDSSRPTNISDRFNRFISCRVINDGWRIVNFIYAFLWLRAPVSHRRHRHQHHHHHHSSIAAHVKAIYFFFFLPNSSTDNDRYFACIQQLLDAHIIFLLWNSSSSQS